MEISMILEGGNTAKGMSYSSAGPTSRPAGVGFGSGTRINSGCEACAKEAKPLAVHRYLTLYPLKWSSIVRGIIRNGFHHGI